MKQEYDQGFYEKRRSRTLPAARHILQIVRQKVPFQSVVDFGCGTGTWLSAALELGAENVTGFEGKWLRREMVDDPRIALNLLDLEQRISLERPVDLAISLEVAEHLSEGRASTFVEDLCAASDVVLFSAAVPNQGGRGHVNEQWQSYWADLFLRKGYRGYDVVRPQIWGNEAIRYWYQQNTMLFIKTGSEPGDMRDTHREPYQMDMIHRELYQRMEGRLPLERLKKVWQRVAGR
ncbi:hypothetical protein A6U87_08375 [Rhizobium sp. AC44/96]|uniref:class I SAM-dependent methyltransferase n=1 Tax=unclassified Rhizobium TaxID=2613769 RepID=UPI00080FEF44|nr:MULTISPECIES: class I SAM-dependent methyltransferase [unclassified Rhizobium]MDM9622817.1 class I SAM-dependent methyltransferase [Rhizobium sp. S96]OCJ13275.1 hypothetical protein A6U87_08375 [Rhizobium sp. AC44/96]